MKYSKIYAFIILIFYVACNNEKTGEEDKLQVQGWNILSNQEDLARMVIDSSENYSINHLQLSHHIIMDLRHAKNPQRAAMVNRLTDQAHEAGVEEVCIWDHALYYLDYYPKKFRTGPDSLLNLDNPEFWSWIKNDYREMLDLVPNIDGVILTFIETGAHVEDQYSEVYQTEEEKLAAMVDTLASVIIDERDLQLYVRTFVYNKAELSSMLKCINLVKNPKLRVMTKEVPHDFFLTHPVAEFVSRIKFPTIIEFDAAHEYNGQGIVASAFPEVHLSRWNFYKSLPNVIGYVARTDRQGNTTIINNPAEINLYALNQAYSDQADPDWYSSFICKNYGCEAAEFLVPALKLSQPIISSSFYTLGININSHSRLHWLDNSSYQRHVSGKWMDEPIAEIGHGVNKNLHYWKDVVNHLAPAWYKKSDGTQLAKESHWVLDSGWLQPEEMMDTTYLNYVMKEKAFGVRKAKEALDLVKKAELLVQNKRMYDTLLHVYERTYLTAQLYEATAKLFFGYRVFARGESYQTPAVSQIILDGLEQTKAVALEMKEYAYPGPIGQFDWQEDIYRGLGYYNAVKYRDTNDFGPGFFPNYGFGRMPDEERMEIWNKAMEVK